MSRDLVELVETSARKYGDKPAIVTPEGDSLSYAELAKGAAAFHEHLVANGCNKGDRVVLSCNNTPAFFRLFFGAIRAGCVAIPIDSNLAVAELERIFAHAEPKMGFADERSLAKIRSAAKDTFRVEPVASIPLAGSLPAGPVDPDALATLLYTSGTTGNPKGVMHTQQTLGSKLEAIQSWFGFDDSYRALCLLPTHFGHGLICNCLATLRYGGTLVLCRPFDLDLVSQLPDLLRKHEVNTFSSVPAVVRLLTRAAERRPPGALPSLRFVTCASAPLQPEDIEAFQKTFGVPLLNTYGITETASWTAFSPKAGPRDLGSVGRMHNCEIRAVDSEGKPLPPGEAGELQVRGPSVMKGYFRAPDLTAAAIKDGWFHTGDLGKVDEEGQVFLLSRLKELIIRAGMNIYPAEVDAALNTHAAVQEAFAVGLDDPTFGEVVGACVVLREGATADERTLINHCRERLAAYKCPVRIRFVEAIPKTSRGKVNRSNLKPLFAPPASS